MIQWAGKVASTAAEDPRFRDSSSTGYTSKNTIVAVLPLQKEVGSFNMEMVNQFMEYPYNGYDSNSQRVNWIYTYIPGEIIYDKAVRCL